MMNESRFTALADKYMDMVYRIALNAVGSGVQLEDGSWQMKYQWSMPVDTAQVKAVKFGKTEVEVE